jgi:hypothetical protein
MMENTVRAPGMSSNAEGPDVRHSRPTLTERTARGETTAPCGDPRREVEMWVVEWAIERPRTNDGAQR